MNWWFLGPTVRWDPTYCRFKSTLEVIEEDRRRKYECAPVDTTALAPTPAHQSE